MKAPLSPDEAKRLDALRRYDILDTPREPAFDDAVELAAHICEAPIAVINLIDEGRQWFKAEVGLGVRETPLDASICAHAILQPGIFEIPDTLEDSRFADNPLCTGAPNLRFYTGALLQSPEGQPIGTLCVLDHRPRRLTELQKQTLKVLSHQVMAQIELRQALKNARLLMQEMDHRVKNSLALVSGLLQMQARRSTDRALRSELEAARDRVAAIANLHELLHLSSSVEAVDLAQFVDRMVEDLAKTSRSGVRLRSEVAPTRLDPRYAALLGVLVNEMVTNALRHAFPDGREGEVVVRFQELQGAGHRLVVEDDGIGFPETLNGSAGLGTMLLERLSQQLGGTLSRDRLARGTRITLDLSAREH